MLCLLFNIVVEIGVLTVDIYRDKTVIVTEFSYSLGKRKLGGTYVGADATFKAACGIADE
jgi:hypothetical protein